VCLPLRKLYKLRRQKNSSPRAGSFATMPDDFSRENHPFPITFRMKAKIIITPKKAVLDPQGKTVQSALEHMGYTGVTGVHIGKYIEIDLAPGTDKAAAQKAINDAAHKLLSNPVIEDYRLEITD
jgi:phosphoribosylformylglycinamidine synthase PurS subunit